MTTCEAIAPLAFLDNNFIEYTMRHTKRKRLINRKIGQRILLGIALVILLWSRILVNIATIQSVQASFPNEQLRGDFPTPSVESIESDELVASHVIFQEQVSGDKGIPLSELTERKKKIQEVEEFYARWNAPMGAHATYIVDVAAEFGIDYRLIPAISIVESSGGRYCFRPYNAFGWGKMGFASFEDAIYTVSKGLAEGYGTDNPHAIAPTYNPVTPVSWANKVAGLMSQI